MVELRQANVTHSSASARSRFDRFYTNEHIVEQLDKKLAAVAFSWAPTLSNHRAMLFSRSRPNGLLEDMRPIKLHIVEHDDFPR